MKQVTKRTDKAWTREIEEHFDENRISCVCKPIMECVSELGEKSHRVRKEIRSAKKDY